MNQGSTFPILGGGERRIIQGLGLQKDTWKEESASEDKRRGSAKKNRERVPYSKSRSAVDIIRGQGLTRQLKGKKRKENTRTKKRQYREEASASKKPGRYEALPHKIKILWS